MKYGLIYCATSPSGKCYIGKTETTLAARISRHRKGNCPVFRAALQKYGDAIQWRVLAVVGAEFLSDVERHYIADYRARGIVLYNCTDGGEGCAGLSDEGRAKISARHKGKTMPPQVKAAVNSPEAIAKRAATKRGQKRTAAQRARMSHSRKRFFQRKTGRLF